jgi:erythromycin esterase-like protein
LKNWDAKYVLLGEASHGTHEYYTWDENQQKINREKKDFHLLP